MATKPNKSQNHLNELIERSNNVLLVAKAVFPFQLIPDRITIDETKVTFENRNILNSNDIQTILIEDIFEVEVVHTLLLASIIIKTNRRTYNLPFLRIAEAMKVKELITGLQVACREGIDLTKLSPFNLTQKLIEIGKPHAMQ